MGGASWESLWPPPPLVFELLRRRPLGGTGAGRTGFLRTEFCLVSGSALAAAPPPFWLPGGGAEGGEGARREGGVWPALAEGLRRVSTVLALGLVAPTCCCCCCCCCRFSWLLCIRFLKFSRAVCRVNSHSWRSYL